MVLGPAQSEYYEDRLRNNKCTLGRCNLQKIDWSSNQNSCAFKCLDYLTYELVTNSAATLRYCKPSRAVNAIR